MRHCICIVLGLVLVLACAPARAADATDQTCQQAGTDDTLRPLPAGLVPVARKVFALPKLPDAQVKRSTVLRCLDGKALLCTTGANLPCGKANTSRSLPAATSWCKAHPDEAAIPMAVTGHDTVYRWRCAGGEAATLGLAEQVDARGFIARHWKPAQ